MADISITAQSGNSRGWSKVVGETPEGFAWVAREMVLGASQCIRNEMVGDVKARMQQDGLSVQVTR